MYPRKTLRSIETTLTNFAICKNDKKIIKPGRINCVEGEILNQGEYTAGREKY